MVAKVNIENITDREQEFGLINQYLEKQIKGRSEKQLKNFHGVKLSRKRPIKVNGKSYQLNHSFILVYDEKENKVKSFLLTPGKPRDDLESGLLGKGSLGKVKRVHDQAGQELALKIIDEDVYYKAQLKINADQITQQLRGWGIDKQIDENTVPALNRLWVFKTVKNLFMTMVNNEIEVLKHAGLRHAVFKRSYSGLGLLKRFILWLFKWNTYKSYFLMDLVPGKPLVRMDMAKITKITDDGKNPFMLHEASLKIPVIRGRVFADGEDCALDKPKINAKQKLDSALQLAEKFAVLHEKGWALLDVKGENILHYSEEGGKIEVSPIDFGFAEPIGKELGILGFKGTLLYCAPEMLQLREIMALNLIGRASKEQLNKKIKVTDKMDVYSLGVVFQFELNLGEHFQGLQSFINSMLSEDPNARPTMRQVGDVLLSHAGASATPQLLNP